MKKNIAISRKPKTETNVENSSNVPVIDTHEEIMAPEAQSIEEPKHEEIPASVPPQQLQNNLFPLYSRKLSYDTAMTILRELRKGTKGSQLAKIYNVDSSTISDIKVGRLYKKALQDFAIEVANEEKKECVEEKTHEENPS